MQDIKTFLANLPHAPGVYQMLNVQGQVIYVGKARDLKKRVSSYFSNKEQDLKTTHLMKQVVDVAITVTHSESEAVLLECNLIKKFAPHYNVLLRDDKSYPYILITNETYPRIDIYRGKKKKGGQYFGPYPNPAAVRETIHLLQKIFQLRTCTDSFFAGRLRPCLHYQIARCSGPCVELITADAYQQNVQLAILFLQGKSDVIIQELQKKMEQASAALNYELAAHFRDQVARLRQIQEKQYVSVKQGDADIIAVVIKSGITCVQLMSIRGGRLLGSRTYFPSVPKESSIEEIIAAFITQHYLGQAAERDRIPREVMVSVPLPERSLLAHTLSQESGHPVSISRPMRGDRKKWLGMAEMNAKQAIGAQLVNKTNIQQRITALQEHLQLPVPPNRIECFDISHSMGEATVASCVVFDSQGPVKSAYRRFNITDVTAGDDFGAMRQVLMRRFKQLQKEEAMLPDLILIDGGKGQLSAALKVLQEVDVQGITMIGVAKGEGRKPGLEVLHFTDRPPLHLPSDSLALHFIQQIRDEAHRFAITGHRQRRDKTRRTSVLESIPGIGAQRRRELLRYFGGIQALSRASLDELCKVPGISQALAQRIFAVLHDAAI